jgi:hypothetical protein
MCHCHCLSSRVIRNRYKGPCIWCSMQRRKNCCLFLCLLMSNDILYWDIHMCFAFNLSGGLKAKMDRFLALCAKMDS